MIITCSKCGHINNVGNVKFDRPTVTVRCKNCGSMEVLNVGTTSHQIDETWAVEKKIPQYLLDEDGQMPEESSEDASEGISNVRTKFLRVVAVVVVMAFLAMLLPYLGHVYFHMKSSGAYKAAETLIRKSPEIKALAGSDPNISIVQQKFTEDSEGQGRAKLGLKVTGTSGSTDVIVYLIKEKGSWRITSALYRDRYGNGRNLEVP